MSFLRVLGCGYCYLVIKEGTKIRIVEEISNDLKMPKQDGSVMIGSSYPDPVGIDRDNNVITWEFDAPSSFAQENVAELLFPSTQDNALILRFRLKVKDDTVNKIMKNVTQASATFMESDIRSSSLWLNG